MSTIWIDHSHRWKEWIAYKLENSKIYLKYLLCVRWRINANIFPRSEIISDQHNAYRTIQVSLYPLSTCSFFFPYNTKLPQSQRPFRVVRIAQDLSQRLVYIPTGKLVRLSSERRETIGRKIYVAFNTAAPFVEAVATSRLHDSDRGYIYLAVISR